MLSYIYLGLGVVLAGILIALFFISRKSQKIMDSLLTLILQPEQAKIKQAKLILQSALQDEITKIIDAFNKIQETLSAQIQSVAELNKTLTVQNDNLVNTADDATKKIAQMSQRLDNTVMGLQNTVASPDWQNIETTTNKFNDTVNDILLKITDTNTNTAQQVDAINSQINTWITSSTELQGHLNGIFTQNTEQMQSVTQESNNMQTALSTLCTTVSDEFEQVKNGATEYQAVMTEHEKNLNSNLTQLEEYSKQSKKQLTTQANTLTTTANLVGGQIRLAEASIGKQIKNLNDAITKLMDSATTTENSVHGVSSEMAGLTNRFNNEIKEFANSVVNEIQTVSGVANVTLDNTKSAATKFSDSVKAMATGVRETLIEMNTAHTQLSAQSESLIKVSAQTTAQLQPLSELIEKYYTALPDLANQSTDINDKLIKIVSELNNTINTMKTSVSDSTSAINESAIKLDDLAGQSRQQMIDLMSDYAKAVNTMQTLNKQMMVARATAPMDAIKNAGTKPIAAVSGSDFITSVQNSLSKLHEQSVDLTRALGAEIPDVIWQKYHGGDTTIFSKWLAKMLKAADAKQIREMLKNDTVFRSQATQFVRSFDNILSAAGQTDTPDATKSKLLKTDLGIIFTYLKGK